MAKDFVKLSEVAIKEEVSENATVLVEENGEIYRAPKTQVGGAGGAGGIKTAIIRDSAYLNAIEQLQNGRSMVEITYECINMTFDEAYETMANGEPLMVVGMFTSEGALCLYGDTLFLGIALNGMRCIAFSFNFAGSEKLLFWTIDGISTNQPVGDK